MRPICYSENRLGLCLQRALNKMGRKIPGRKHRGIRDPDKQREVRLQKLKGKIDLPPSDPDHQEIPHSLNRIIELKEIAKNSRRKPKKNKNEFLLERERGESERDYLHRVDAYCDDIIQENAFENKHSVDVKRNLRTGEIEDVVKREDDELEELVKKKKEGKLKKRQRLGDKDSIGRLTKSQKRQRKLAEKKQKKMLEKQLDNYVVKDHVKFGEVVHAPPTLSTPRKAFKSDGAARPGQKNLLLKSMLVNDAKQKNKVEVKENRKQKSGLNQTTHRVIDKKGKRKHLPNALRRRIEDQQTEIIKAYRKLKEQKALKK